MDGRGQKLHELWSRGEIVDGVSTRPGKSQKVRQFSGCSTADFWPGSAVQQPENYQNFCSFFQALMVMM